MITVIIMTAARVWAHASSAGSSVAAVLAYGPMSGRSCTYSINYIVIWLSVHIPLPGYVCKIVPDFHDVSEKQITICKKKNRAEKGKIVHLYRNYAIFNKILTSHR